MDEVWIISLCLTLFAFFILVLSSRPKAEPEPESIRRLSVSAPASYGGKTLHVDEEEVEKMMARLTNLLREAEEKKREVFQERSKIVPQDKEEERSQHRRDVANADETQESMGRSPEQTQPAYQLSHRRVQVDEDDVCPINISILYLERSPPSGVENIMDEIEQAVQETVDPDYYTRRRQQRRQWSEVTGRGEMDNI